ncbi:ph-response sensor protein, partial [Ascosphaera acerosa]
RFNNRARVISDFYIEPDDPWRTYCAGDLVKGTVVLSVIKPLRVTHLTVCLHGFAKVHRNTVMAGDGSPVGTAAAGPHAIVGEHGVWAGGESFPRRNMGSGYAPLFEDEVSLCGEGRLKEGQYRFMFELEFPRERLPSSINFERGTISYLITATLTRPTTISPIFTCDRRLVYAETIDIGPLAAPKPRVISLEPISRKSKSRSKILTTTDHLSRVTSASTSLSTTTAATAATTATAPQQHQHQHQHQHFPPATSSDSPDSSSGSTPTSSHLRPVPQSPAPSDLSHASTVSSSVHAAPGACASPSAAQVTPALAGQSVPHSHHDPSVTSTSTSTSTATPAASTPGLHETDTPVSPKLSIATTATSGSATRARSITAMIELLKGGGLPGDQIPLKIIIKHTKPVHSTNGIIITLYRQGRVDWKPPQPSVVPDDDVKTGTLPSSPSTSASNGSSTGRKQSKGKKPAQARPSASSSVSSDANPRSRTGLGVLSFGNARTKSIFRKDLSQTFAPLLVDPTTMKAAVNTSIRIPEDVFPTIKDVPGGMISFRYYVEVVMDLRGRLDRYLPTPQTTAAGPASYSYSPAAQSFDIDQGRNLATSTTYGGNILDTDQVRREKSVVSCSFEVVVGTRDTSRTYDKVKRHARRETQTG